MRTLVVIQGGSSSLQCITMGLLLLADQTIAVMRKGERQLQRGWSVEMNVWQLLPLHLLSYGPSKLWHIHLELELRPLKEKVGFSGLGLVQLPPRSPLSLGLPAVKVLEPTWQEL